MAFSPTQLELLPLNETGENPRYLEEQLITYLGNKRALLPFIGKAVSTVKSRLGQNKLRTLDLFSGSGVVARYLKKDSSFIVTNDLEPYSKIINECYLTNTSEFEKIEFADILKDLKSLIIKEWNPGFITNLYAPKDENNITESDRVFYTRYNAIYIDTVRKLIDKYPINIRKYFLGPLLSEASIHANTSGVFKGYYKNAHGIGQYGGNRKDALTRICGKIDLNMPVLSWHECSYSVLNGNANKIVEEVPEVDLAYFDPPYNQHPYGSNYFMLNLILDYNHPNEISTVSGIPSNWQRSNYNKRKFAEEALFDSIRKVKASHVLVSYNSEGFVSHNNFLEQMRLIGKLHVMETPYNTFRGSRNLRDRALHVTEYLYLLEK